LDGVLDIKGKNLWSQQEGDCKPHKGNYPSTEKLAKSDREKSRDCDTEWELGAENPGVREGEINRLKGGGGGLLGMAEIKSIIREYWAGRGRFPKSVGKWIFGDGGVGGQGIRKGGGEKKVITTRGATTLRGITRSSSERKGRRREEKKSQERLFRVRGFATDEGRKRVYTSSDSGENV